MTTRRRFLGGCFAAIFIPTLPLPEGVLPCARSWMWVRKLPGYSRDPSSTNVRVGYQALRSDGQYFYSGAWVPEEDIELIGMVFEHAREVLNSFLSSKCECTVGFYCDLHNHMEESRIPVKLSELEA